MLQKLEAKSKKQAFVSHGDFRQYLYEATIFAMPCTKATNETAEIRLFYHFSHKLGFSIIVQLEKNPLIFQHYRFGEKQQLQTQFMAK